MLPEASVAVLLFAYFLNLRFIFYYFSFVIVVNKSKHKDSIFPIFLLKPETFERIINPVLLLAFIAIAELYPPVTPLC